MRKYCRILGVSAAFGLLFWILDGVYDYFSFNETIRELIFHEPLSLWDALLFNVPRDDILARSSFMAACLLGGLLVVWFVRRVELAESVLTQSERRARLLFENALAGLYCVSPKGRLVTVNPAFARMLGYDDVAQCLEYFAREGHDVFGDAALWADTVRQALESGEPVVVEHAARTCEGGEVWLLHSLQAVGSEDGSEGHLECSAVNITHRRMVEEYRRVMSQEMVRVQEQERRLLALELHDNHAQDLAALKIALATLCDGHPEAQTVLEPGLERCQAILDRAIGTVRALMHGLQPYELEYIGLADIVSNHLARFAKQTGVAVDFQGDGVQDLDLAHEHKVHVFRILQESLNNVQRHAQASNVSVRMALREGELRMRIEDDGVGFQPNRQPLFVAQDRRVGLQSMRERAALLGGGLEIDSAPGRGTRISLTVPFAG